MMLSLDAPRGTRKPDLTPMIDVVFLLLVFFMLASRFAQDRSLPLSAATGAATEWHGPLRLVDVGAGGAVALNGSTLPQDSLAAQLGMLVESPDDPILLRGRAAQVQDLTRVMEYLRGAGFRRLVLME